MKDEILNVEEGQLSEGQKGKIKPVPKGYLAVYVGEEGQKFVIPAKYLSMPDFRALLDDVGDEYGYQYEGGLRIPCEEHEFEKILRICNNDCPMQKKNLKKIPSMVLF
ncbi:hypothetical protein Leryth_011366 [Lithospermum erythrorhizon]|uniref:Uncharacterized protein n=1 Tax=Lithospermum erythrorhizon TaxID=34254 RepID=A0AAV3RQD3_LITER|nr:hypothetical protein Leryth_011366 [Lithospermum erythrorhizon]